MPTSMWSLSSWILKGLDLPIAGQIYREADLCHAIQVLARYTHRGIKSTARIEYVQPGLEMTYIKLASEPVGDGGDRYTGLDRFNRIIDVRWLKTSTGSDVDRFKYGFDFAGNR